MAISDPPTAAKEGSYRKQPEGGDRKIPLQSMPKEERKKKRLRKHSLDKKKGEGRSGMAKANQVYAQLWKEEEGSMHKCFS